ncbi:MAG: hypothetical protein RLZZ366_1367 [Pseudomonadota bacterium]|jgi:molybdenum cofactor cytidylyltransferase
MKVGAIILAGGLSRRMGRNKLLEQISGKPMLLHVVDAIAEAGFDPPMIALGHEASEISRILGKDSYQPVIVDDFSKGIAHSLRATIKEIPASWDAVFICLGDMPWVSATLLRSMAAVAETDRILIPTSGGRRGNPVLWGRAFFGELQSLIGDFGGKQLFAHFEDTIVEFETSDLAIHRDIDTISQLEEFAAKG